MPHILNDNNLIAALDIGTSKTSCVLAYSVNENKAVIVGAGSFQNTGVKKSEIIALAPTVESVQHAVAIAEGFIKNRIKTVVATACVGTLSSAIIQDSLDLDGKEVTQSDISRLIASAQNKIPDSDDEILHCTPIDYSLDSRYSIADPRGLTGNKLYLSLNTVMTPPYPVRDMNSVLEQTHLSCSKKVASPYAAGLACLTQEEKKQGTAVIDLGAGTTGIGVFYENQLVFTAKIPFGGDLITKDLAIAFRTSLDNAERLKTLKGSCMPSAAYEHEEVEIPLIGEDESVSAIRVPRSMIVQKIAPRIEDMFEKIKSLLEQNGFYNICTNFVLTGGGALLHGINEKAATILQRNVRTGQPVRLFDKQGIIPPHAYQSYMCCIGLLHYTTRVLLNTPIHQRDVSAPKNKFVRFFRWFLDNS
ncbi:MAG: cell division protein FtsA [Alphaproteobacteria bacterium]|nr:cell division protein FtsA [Alphaproteobacteria bacterium]